MATIKTMKAAVKMVGATLKVDRDYWELRQDGETLTNGENNERMADEVLDSMQAYFGSHPRYEDAVAGFGL